MANAQSTFSIKGKIDDVKEPAKVVLQYTRDGKRFVDTTDMVSGNFSFQGRVESPRKSLLIVMKSSDKSPRIAAAYNGEVERLDGITLYLDKGNISITGATIKEAIAKGSAAHDDYTELQKQLKPYYANVTAISRRTFDTAPAQQKGTDHHQKMSALQVAAAQLDFRPERICKIAS